MAETAAREARADDIERIVFAETTIRRTSQNPTLRTTLFCEYDIFACNVARVRATSANRARAFRARLGPTFRARDRTRAREFGTTLERERKALADFSERRANEIRATDEAVRFANALSDENAALTLTLANLDTELRTQELLVLQRVEEEVRGKLVSHPEVRRMRDNVARLERENVEIVDETRARVEAISKRLPKFIDANDIDEIAAIARECEPLRSLPEPKHLFEARNECRAERERRERLDRVFRTRAGRVRDYATRMYEYLNWLRCFDRANARGYAVCTDEDARRAYRNDYSWENDDAVILNSIPRINVDFMQKATRFVFSDRSERGENVRASMLTHALISDMFDCLLPKTNVVADVGKEFFGTASTLKTATDVVLQRLFRWPVGLPEPEKRGLAFAVFAATCPRE